MLCSRKIVIHSFPFHSVPSPNCEESLRRRTAFFLRRRLTATRLSTDTFTPTYFQHFQHSLRPSQPLSIQLAIVFASSKTPNNRATTPQPLGHRHAAKAESYGVPARSKPQSPQSALAPTAVSSLAR
ncbi:hypothetical protein B5807_06063 [Epicoccum nigrum]|uniref:Uncharacterized protein n=1 Tax=Epicoccum nigrum TaxID=105696 RepID=A0A1Y2M209_EPING|nr:hypothetical protein B5807_06063 [Epicoccum nigrum]